MFRVRGRQSVGRSVGLIWVSCWNLFEMGHNNLGILVYWDIRFVFKMQEDLGRRLRGRANALPLSFRFAALQIRSLFYQN